VTESSSPRGVITLRHRRDQSRLNETPVGNDEGPFAVAYPVSDRRPQLSLPFGQSRDGPAASHNLGIADEDVRPVAVLVVAELGLRRFPCVPAHVDAVVDREAHRDGSLHGAGHSAGDDKGELAGLLAHAASEGHAVGREVRTAATVRSFPRSAAWSSTTISLLLPQGKAFSSSGTHALESGNVVRDGFDATSRFPTGGVYLSTTRSAGGQGGPSTRYTAWAGVTWDFTGEVITASKLSSAPTVDPTFTAFDPNGHEVYTTRERRFAGH
jgi:hypothetical protein